MLQSNQQPTQKSANPLLRGCCRTSSVQGQPCPNGHNTGLRRYIPPAALALLTLLGGLLTVVCLYDYSHVSDLGVGGLVQPRGFEFKTQWKKMLYLLLAVPVGILAVVCVCCCKGIRFRIPKRKNTADCEMQNQATPSRDCNMNAAGGNPLAVVAK